MSTPGWITEDTNDHDYFPEGGDTRDAVLMDAAPGASASAPAGAPGEWPDVGPVTEIERRVAEAIHARICCDSSEIDDYDVESARAAIAVLAQPTPAALREWAAKLDGVTMNIGDTTASAGYFLRCIADDFADAMEGR